MSLPTSTTPVRAQSRALRLLGAAALLGLALFPAGVVAQATLPALLRDLKARGLWEDSLVVWGGEFGRTPTNEGANGRDHHALGFSMWLAGGGVKGGYVHGATDEFGFAAREKPVHVYDLHATILHLMGLDHTRLVYLHKGRPERATLNEGEVFEKVLTG